MTFKTLPTPLASLLSLAVWLAACGTGDAPAPPPNEPMDSTAAGSEPVVEAVTTLYLVRHAEKEPTGDDPPLSPAGQARADNLARLFARIPLEAVYATPFVRARETAVPLAEAQGLEVTEYSAEEDLVSLVDSLRLRHAGGSVFVVGHKTTLPGMLNVLTDGKGYEELEDGDDDGLWEVVMVPGREVRVVEWRVGGD